MSLTEDERDFLRDLIKPTETQESDLTQFLSADVYELLKNKNNLRTVTDRILFVNHNRYRPYDSVQFTKFLRPDFNCSRILKHLFEYITPPYLVFIDFHFLFECKSEDKNEKLVNLLKFQTASKASALNDTIKITEKKDFDSLVAEFSHKSHADLLDDVYRHHVDLYEYQNSGLKPYQLLSLVVHLQKFPN